MKKIFLIILFFNYFIVNSQNNKIDNIVLKHNGGVFVGKDSRIHLSMRRGSELDKYIDAYIKVDRKEYFVKMSITKFDEFCEEIKKINPIDIINNAPLYLDAAETELSFSMWNNTVTYNVSGLSNNDTENSRKHFLEIIKFIINEFSIKIPNVN